MSCTPYRWLAGWAWDAVIGNVNFPIADTTITRAHEDPRIEATTSAKICDASIGDHAVEVLAVHPVERLRRSSRSVGSPPLASEIALGSRLGPALDARVGDLVRFSVARANRDR